MYSYQDRMRAVQLFIKLGKRVKATIRQLGYPTKNALKGWYQEYEHRLDLPTGYTRKPRYSSTQKAAAVKHYLDHGRSIAFTIKSLGYPGRCTLSAWIGELHPELRVRVVSRSGQAHEHAQAMKHAAVVALCTRDASAEALAREFGVCRATLYNWKNKLLGSEVPVSRKRLRDLPSQEREEFERQLEELRRDVHRLKLEQDLLKKANEMLKKDEGIIPQHLSNRGEDAAG